MSRNTTMAPVGDSSAWLRQRFAHRFALALGTTLLAACATDGPGPSEPEPFNDPPTAAFTAACSGLTCILTDESADDDGNIETYRWDFGDGAASTEPHPSHTYARPGGEFSVALIVTDDAGDSATTSRQVTVQPDESALVSASFNFACTVLTCSFSDRSSGPVASHVWDFGDGSGSDQESPNHTFAQPGGHFTVSLTVIDSSGAESTASEEVDVHSAEMRDISGTYERETNDGSRHSRIVIRSDGTLDLLEWTGTDTLAYPGRWRLLDHWVGMALAPGTVIGLDFEHISESEICGEAYGVFLTEADLALALCGPPIAAGLREGVYSSAPSTTTTLPPPGEGQIAFVRDGRIYRVNIDGTDLLPLTEGPADGDPAWSPDGSRIAFTNSSASASGIYLIDADGSHAVRLTTSGSDADWSPDGQWLVYVCRTPAVLDQDQLCTVGTDGSSTEPVGLTPWLRGQVYSPTWSPDGNRIAFTSDWAASDIMFDIWTIAPDGSEFTAISTHTPGAPTPWEFHRPAWSPDGRLIAHVICPWAWNFCSSSAIQVMNADGSGTTLLVTASGYGSPTWSSNGQVIAFSSGAHIEWVSADGSQRGRIIEDGHSPSWRP